MTTHSSRDAPACLWLTRFYPYPCHAGDRIYSARLIEALAATGCSLTVHCAGGTDHLPPPEGAARTVDWIQAPAARPIRLLSYPLSRLPRQALALSGPAQRSSVRALLRRQRWDAIVVDYVSMGWVLPLVEECWPDASARPPLIHVSHNHEASLRRSAAPFGESVATRLALRLDAARVATLEERLVAASTLVTVNTEADRMLFRDAFPNQRYEVLLPAYDGPTLSERRLTSATPRRVVVVGSFDWIAKQRNLIDFLEASVGPLAEGGVGIDVVGRGPVAVLAALRKRFPGVAIHGTVDAVEPYLQGARISVIPERVGGGFKHKALNAVFQRTPIFALAGSIAGLPLDDGRSVRLLPDFAALVAAILDGIDDLEGLNAQQNAAFAACIGRFDWAERGAFLRALIDEISRPAPGSCTPAGISPR